MRSLFFTLLFCIHSLSAGTINVAVAANVSYAIEELVQAFHKEHPHTVVALTLGGSGKLTAQIKNGAPYDIFLSANMHYPDALYKEGLALTKPRIYAEGSLALLSHKKRDFHTSLARLLDSKEIRRIAIANPKTAPYGVATKEALETLHLYKKLQHKFIYAESISQTVLYTVTAADFGFIAKSSLFSPQLNYFKKNVNYIEIDPKLYKPIAQGIVILKHAVHKSEAKDFYAFIIGKEAKKIFVKYGYLLP